MHEADRVFALEDNNVDYLLVQHQLQRWRPNISITRATCRAEIVAQKAARWNLVIADLHLTDIEEDGLIQLVKEIWPDVPCILTSGSLRALHQWRDLKNCLLVEKGDLKALEMALAAGLSFPS